MNILERLGLISSSIVLDLGFRDPNELVLISNLVGEQGLVYGIEPDQSLIAKTIEQVNHIKNVRPMVGDASKVPLSDKSVDVVIFKGVLHEVGNPSRALSEAGRVCREGGKILIVDFSAYALAFMVKSEVEAASSGKDLRSFFGQASRFLGRCHQSLSKEFRFGFGTVRAQFRCRAQRRA